MAARVKVLTIVCIAIFAITAIAAAPMFALFDAQTLIDVLFWAPAAAPLPPLESLALPAAPPARVHASRAPPLS